MLILPQKNNQQVVKTRVIGVRIFPITLLFFLSVIGCSALLRNLAPVKIEQTKVFVKTRVDTVKVVDTETISKLKRELRKEKEKNKVNRTIVSTTLEKEINSLSNSYKPISHSNSHSNSKNLPITNIISDPTVLEFITHNQVLQRAYEISQITGLNVSTIIAQKGFESRWGQSALTKITKNLGNIKCNNKACKKRNKKGLKKKTIGDVGPHCVQLYDDKGSDRFVRFQTFQAGWDYYLATMKKRYARAGKANNTKDQIAIIKQLGYATDKAYVSKVFGIVKRYNLQKLDQIIDQGYNITTETGKFTLLTR